MQCEKFDIKIRPHHALCIQNFIEKGYSNYFVENMRNTINYLNSNPNIILKLSCDVDIICECCPNNILGECSSKDKVLFFDKKCLELCELNNNTLISWEALKRKSMVNILIPQRLECVCEGCCWIDICKKNIKKELY